MKTEKFSLLSTVTESFHFNLSSHGRLSQPIKISIVDTIKGGIRLWSPGNSMLIDLGDIVLYKENRKDESYCKDQRRDKFNYGEIKNSLCGITQSNGGPFSLKRFLVYQLL